LSGWGDIAPVLVLLRWSQQADRLTTKPPSFDRVPVASLDGALPGTQGVTNLTVCTSREDQRRYRSLAIDVKDDALLPEGVYVVDLVIMNVLTGPRTAIAQNPLAIVEPEHWRRPRLKPVEESSMKLGPLLDEHSDLVDIHIDAQATCFLSAGVTLHAV
jgi:hypothetical protein